MPPPGGNDESEMKYSGAAGTLIYMNLDRVELFEGRIVTEVNEWSLSLMPA